MSTTRALSTLTVFALLLAAGTVSAEEGHETLAPESAVARESDTNPFPLVAVSGRGGLLFAPKLGDRLDGSAGLGLGAMATFSANYRPRKEFEIGFDLSYLTASQSIDRATVTNPYEGYPGYTGGRSFANMHITTEGPAAGLHVSYQRGDRFLYGARLGLGTFFGFSRQDWSSVVFGGSGGTQSPRAQHSFGAYVHIAPGLNVGYRLTKHLTALLGADLQLLVPIMPTTPSAIPKTWTADTGASILPLFGPTLDLRYDFFDF